MILIDCIRRRVNRDNAPIVDPEIANAAHQDPFEYGTKMQLREGIRERQLHNFHDAIGDRINDHNLTPVNGGNSVAVWSCCNTT